MKAQLKKYLAKLRRKKLLMLGAVIVLVIIGWKIGQRQPEATLSEPYAAATITYSTDTPDETKPKKEYQWRGGANDPRLINLPTIQTEGFIQNVGVDQNKQIAVPNNIHLAGWFVDSVQPGQTGLSIIDGHVDGRKNDGIFKHLAGLKENDEYTIEMGDGRLKRYRVKTTVTVATKDAAGILFSQDPKIKSQLNLVTCGGSFDRQSRQYDKRIIVSSELIQ
jgi:sortase A